ncbi:MAG: HDIG domain-containing protein [Methanoregula sp.]|nr:MAG: HDIG domain-containing protein [Methanoregula sp.]
MSSPREQYEDLLRNAGCSPKVIAHCRAVTDCALEYAGNNPLIDRNLLEAGAMLHDIGRGKTHSIHHAQTGADICRALLFTEPVARIVECHTGAGLTADECTLLHLLPRNCTPCTAEERILAHADNLMVGTHKGRIEGTLGSAIHLSRKIRRRLYHLALDVECLCKK